MDQTKTYFKIGLFVIVSIAAMAGVFLYITADAIRGEPVLIETYLDESVQGLSPGSQVLYRGVAIGQVREITFVPLEYPLEVSTPEYEQFSRYVMVVMAINSDYFPGLGDGPDRLATIRRQVQLGLRFKLSYQGITGIVFMEADYITSPEQSRPLEVPWEPRHIYVPSSPSLVTSFTVAVERIFRRIEEIDIEAIFTKLESALDSIQTTLQDAQIAQVRQELIAAAREFVETNRQIRQFLQEADSIPESLRTSLEQFQSTMTEIEMLIDQNRPEVERTVGDLSRLVRSLRQLAEEIQRDPAQLLFSVPPSPSERVR